MATAFQESTENQSWLKCRLDKGMFTDERAVTYPPEGAIQKSVFVPATVVEMLGDHNGRVRVRIVVRDGRTFAVLPSANRDIVSVIRDQDVSNE